MSDPYKDLAMQMLRFIRDGMEGHRHDNSDARMWSTVELSVLEAWERRVRILEKGPSTTTSQGETFGDCPSCRAEGSVSTVCCKCGVFQ